MRVAIVDSGIDPKHPLVGSISGGISIKRSGGRTVRTSDDWDDDTGHGTACAGIVRKIAPKAMIFSVRIFDRVPSSDATLLESGLEWAIENEMDIANVSLGTVDWSRREALASVCRRARKAGLLVVAAAHPAGCPCLPAFLQDVIGVGVGSPDGTVFGYRPGESIECIARGAIRRVCWKKGKRVIAGGTSLGAAEISGIVALIRSAHPTSSLDQVRAILKANAKQASSSKRRPQFESAPSERLGTHSIRKAILYPFNKEMHAFVRFRDLLRFEISGIADPPGKGLVGKDAGQAAGIETLGVRIAPRLADSVKGADTLILGYVDQLSRICRRDVLEASVHTALQHGLNVFSFEAVPQSRYPELYAKAAGGKRKIWYPRIASQEIERASVRGQDRQPIASPVLGVFGTSSNQGKFTLQLILRRELIKRGFRLGQLGTEHHSLLFGMEAAFPIGYGAPVDFPLQFYAPYVQMQSKRPRVFLDTLEGPYGPERSVRDD